MRRKTWITICLIALCFGLYAQQKNIEIAGTVYDETGEPLPGATVYIRDNIDVELPRQTSMGNLVSKFCMEM